MPRTESIALSPKEKNRLDSVCEEIYGTTSVPYGEVLSKLMDLYGEAQE